MKDKKGFTLVELLAVIAILAILVIMALPAVLRMYRQSRINNFQNEVRSVYRTAQTKFLGDSMTKLTAGKSIYYTSETCTSSLINGGGLDMTGNSNFKYYVEIDVSGNVNKVIATNGTYSYKNVSGNIQVDKILVEDSTSNSLITSTATFDQNLTNLCP